MRKILALLLLVSVGPLTGHATEVSGMRVWTAPDHVRLVLDTDGPPKHSLFSLKNPDRIVIDLKGADLACGLPTIEKDHSILRNVRGGRNGPENIRVVVDLKGSVKPKSFALAPNNQYGHRLVVDLYPTEVAAKVAKPKTQTEVLNSGQRDIVIAIDAGHGGEDGGARGPSGVHEKDVVYKIARKLEALVEKEQGMKPVMIRTGDYYLGLRKRMQLARKAQADLFISIHADAFSDARVRGSSVYTLSQRGASSEAARWIASRENSADAVGGIELQGKDSMLTSVLVDLSQTATMQASLDAAAQVLKGIKRVGKTHKSRVQQAGFVVLKSPDIPSMLVETAFISNPDEERNLRDPAHQRRMANAMMQGVREYFRRNPPPGTLLASLSPKKHVINRGETLSGIASQYQVNLNLLRRANSLDGDDIHIGQVLLIPQS